MEEAVYNSVHRTVPPSVTDVYPPSNSKDITLIGGEGTDVFVDEVKSATAPEEDGGDKKKKKGKKGKDATTAAAFAASGTAGSLKAEKAGLPSGWVLVSVNGDRSKFRDLDAEELFQKMGSGEASFGSVEGAGAGSVAGGSVGSRGGTAAGTAGAGPAGTAPDGAAGSGEKPTSGSKLVLIFGEPRKTMYEVPFALSVWRSCHVRLHAHSHVKIRP